MKTIYLLFFGTSLIWLTSCSTLMKIAKVYPSDNVVEELIEEAIEAKLELPEGCIDLSPFSEEK